MTADELVEAYGTALRAAAKANAEVEAADDTRKIVRAKEMLAAGEIAATKAEIIATASQPYINAVNTLNAARGAAEDARAEVEYLRARFEKWRTSMSFQKTMKSHER